MSQSPCSTKQSVPSEVTVMHKSELQSRSTIGRSTCFLFTLLTCLCLGLPRVEANVLSWSGGGAPDANWGNINNWGGAGVPANGDTILFQGPQPGLVNTNNIGPLTLNQIRFIGTSGGFDIRGLALTVTNGIENTNGAGVNEIENAMTLTSSNLTVDVKTGTKLILFGVLSGPGGLIKNGGGTNTIAGPLSNTYLGTTVVNVGLMELNKIGSPAATAIPGNLVIGDGTNSTTVRNLTVLEIADTANITINASATWDLNNFSETVGPNLVIDGTITTGSGTCTLSPNASITISNGFTGTITGSLNISSGTCTIQNDGFLTLSAVVSGSANIIKNGIGNTALFGANTFTGTFTANGQGYVWVNTPTGLGTSASPVTLNDQTWLPIAGNITITNAFTVNSAYPLGAFYDFSNDTNTLSGLITLNTNITIQCFTNCRLVISGSISGPGGFTKLDTGVLTLAGPNNSYLGDTTVNDGILFLNSFNVIRHGTLTVSDGNGPPVFGYRSDICKPRLHLRRPAGRLNRRHQKFRLAGPEQLYLRCRSGCYRWQRQHYDGHGDFYALPAFCNL